MNQRRWRRKILERITLMALCAVWFHYMNRWAGLPSSWLDVAVLAALLSVLGVAIETGRRAWRRYRAERRVS